MFTLNNPTKLADLSGYYVTSRDCPMCDTNVTVIVTPQELFAYNQGALAHEVLGRFDADTREQFITGTCADCWNAMFAGLDD